MIVRLRVEDLFKILIIIADKLVELDLCGHKTLDVVSSTQTIVQLTLGGDIPSSWVSLSCNSLPQNISSEYECKSFDCGWSQFCVVLLSGMHCVITQVSDHVMKGCSMAGFSSENLQWFLGYCYHSPLKVLKIKRVGYEQEKRGGVGRGSRSKVRLSTPSLLFPRTMLCSSGCKKSRNIIQFSPITASRYALILLPLDVLWPSTKNGVFVTQKRELAS